jgi:hypothetical protein
MQVYPTWLYKKQDGEIVSMLVKSELEHKAIGDGWADTPAAFDEAPKEEKPRRGKKSE